MSRRFAPILTLTALAATAPALLGCTEQPVIEVRWGFVDTIEARDNGDENPTLGGVLECAESGVSKVQLRVFTEDGSTFVGSRTHDCFPQSFSDDGKLAAGPIIDTPGTYRLEVVGLRGNDEPFERVVLPSSLLFGTEIPAPDPLPGYDCLEGEETFLRTDSLDQGIGTEVTYGFQYCVLASWPPLDGSVDNRFTVDENGEVEWVDFDDSETIPLVRPIECDDGIDNDGDGAVDGADLACQVALDNKEVDDEGFTVIRVVAGFFDSNFVTCGSVDAVKLFLDVRDSEGELVETLESEACVEGDPTLQVGPIGRVLPAGTYSLEGVITTTVNPPPFHVLRPLDCDESPDNPLCMCDEDDADNPDCLCDPDVDPPEGTTCVQVDPPPFQDAVTEGQTQEGFVVPEDAGGVFVTSFNFEPEDFLTPFNEPLQVSMPFEDTPQLNVRFCGHFDSTLLSIDTYEISFADNPEGNDPIFEVEAPCIAKERPGANTEPESVSWDGKKYYLNARAMAGDTVCYEVSGRPLGPEPAFVTFQRLTNDDGSPVAGCEECFEDGDCIGALPNGAGVTCQGGYCVPPGEE